MTEHDNINLVIDRSKRPRLEEEEKERVDYDYEYLDKEDRHPKRQAVPDPETKAPHFAGEEKKEQQKGVNKNQYHEGGDGDGDEDDDDDDDDDIEISVTGSNNTLILRNSQVHLSLRSLVGTKDAGIIIGRGGKNVNEIREHSSSRVTISDNIPGAFDRILSINGSVDAVAKAYSMIGEKILAEIPTEDQDKPETSVSICLLVPDFRMGNLIGRNGSIIKSIQEDSGARLNASEESLPMSTERTLTIHGTPQSIYLASARIADILADHSERSGANHIPYVPLATNPSLPPPLMNRPGYPIRGGGPRSSARISHSVGNTGNAYGMMPNLGIPMGSPYFYQDYGMGPQSGRSSDYGNVSMGHNYSQQMFIPNEMVGCIIGKGGTKINEIRQISGSHIKIMDPSSETNERLITVTGSHETNNMALYLLYSRLESEKARLGMM